MFHFLSESRGCPGCRSVRFVQIERAVSICIRSENSISLKGFKSSPIRVKGVTELVDPYGLCRWKGPFSIHNRSQNCTSLRGLRIKITACLTGVGGAARLVNPYSLYRWKRLFSICIRSENCISLCGQIIIIKRFSSKYYVFLRS